jgi:glycosyltransferase involved in cell wall biosynthesis
VLVGTWLGRPVVIRLGGDFLWESYVERTGEPVPLRQFYQTTQSRWSSKERLIFNLIRWTLRHADKVVFSTDWQREIFAQPYELSPEQVMVIENYYGPKEVSFAPSQKNFIAASRPLKLKNLNLLREVFAELSTATLDTSPSAPAEFLERLKQCYAVVVVSWSEVSPNLILEAIRHNKPFILTRESGLAEQLQGVGLIVNPLDRAEIIQAIEYLLNDTNYSQAIEKVKQFKVIHDWPMIADEFIKIAKTL